MYVIVRMVSFGRSWGGVSDNFPLVVVVFET